MPTPGADEANRYTYRVEWSSRSGQYVARCLELPRVSDSAPTAPEAIALAEKAVADHLVYMDEVFGGEPPIP